MKENNRRNRKLYDANSMTNCQYMSFIVAIYSCNIKILVGLWGGDSRIYITFDSTYW